MACARERTAKRQGSNGACSINTAQLTTTEVGTRRNASGNKKHSKAAMLPRSTFSKQNYTIRAEVAIYTSRKTPRKK